MNEQLIVKNFGPIKDATVDFKRVTVFIGPTGGGKSTLAKLAAVFRDYNYYPTFLGQNDSVPEDKKHSAFAFFNLKSYFSDNSNLQWKYNNSSIRYDITKSTFDLSEVDWKQLGEHDKAQVAPAIGQISKVDTKKLQEVIQAQRANKLFNEAKKDKDSSLDFNAALNMARLLEESINKVLGMKTMLPHGQVNYLPSERNYVASIDYAWPGMLRDDIGLPKSIVNFANKFSTSRKDIAELDIPFLNAKYIHSNGQDFIKIPKTDNLLRLYETASGIQSVTPLLVLLEYLSRYSEQSQNFSQAQSFIIEEPELNLFPLAQFELVKILVEKCAQLEDDNDLVLTTHSPYVLTALNLLCYAYRIAQQDDATAKKVAKLIPRHCWIDPDQFAAYYVDRPDTKRKQQVRSIINKKTGLIEENELDTASDELGAIFDKLVRLRKPTPTPSRAK